MHQQLVVLLLVGLAASAYGLDLSHASSDEARILNILQQFYNQVVLPPLNHIVTNFALLGAQFLAGVANNGLPGSSQRSLTDAELRGFWDDLWNQSVKPQLDNTLSGLALTLAQALANIGVNGLNLSVGKRSISEAELRGFSDVLSELFANVFQKPLEQALQAGALLAAQGLAGIGANGNILDLLFGGLGRSGLSQEARVAELRGIFDGFGEALLGGLQTVWNNVLAGPATQALQTISLLGAQALAGAGANGNIIDTLASLFGGVGKRDLNDNVARALGKRDLQAEPRGPILDGLYEHATGLYQNQVKPLLDEYLSAAAIHLAGVLASFASSGVGR